MGKVRVNTDVKSSNAQGGKQVQRGDAEGTLSSYKDRIEDAVITDAIETSLAIGEIVDRHFFGTLAP